FGAIATAWTIRRLYESERWVEHTYHVQLTLDDVESNLAKAGRSRSFFVTSNDPKFLRDFDDAKTAAFADLSLARRLIADNQEQQLRCDRLEMLMRQRIGASEQSIELAKAGTPDRTAQDKLALQIVNLATQGAALMGEINQTEQVLLAER